MRDLSSRNWRVLVSVLLAGALLAPAASATGTVRPVRTGAAGVVVGGRVTEFATLPRATRARAWVAGGSEAFSPAQLRAVRSALPPGYLGAELHRDGASLRIRLLYFADGAHDGFVVERSGTVGAAGVALAPYGMVVALVADLGARPDGLTTYRVTTASRSVEFAGPNPLVCMLEMAGITIAAIGCEVAAAPSIFGVGACAAGGEVWLYQTATSDTCGDTTTAKLTPKYQVVNGLGYDPGGCCPIRDYQVQLYLEGSDSVPAPRDITVPFATCSASQCETITYRASQTGISRHAFAPLGCDQVRTVYGTVEYQYGWENDSAQVEISNPTC